jgi:hypothetical protein
MLRKVLVRVGKTSYTAGTLCEIKPEIFQRNTPHPCGAKKNFFKKFSKVIDKIKGIG